MPRDTAGSIETPRSWHAALLTLAILSLSFGSPLLAVVGLRDIQEAMHTDRSVIAMASALVWIGNGLGGIPMGWLADWIGIRKVVGTGALMMAAGLALSSLGSVWALYVGHGVLIGFLGNGAIYAPLLVYVSRWFDRRRGTALALISSGQYIAGMIWPPILEAGMKRFGWQPVMLAFAAVVLAVLPLLALLRPPPEPQGAESWTEPVGTGFGSVVPVRAGTASALRPNAVMMLLCVAGFCCCVPMAIPASHLVAAAISASLPPVARRCCRSRWPARSFLGSSGVRLPTGSAVCAPSWPVPRCRRSRSAPSC